MKAILKHKWFIILAVLAFLIRLIYIDGTVIPFGFDHGKDALAVLDMITSLKLKFIGPWTSIQGLYFGPAWYYLLAPFYYFGHYDPYWSVLFMSLLVIFQMFLAYKYFNIESAAIIGFTNYWITLSRSAWNPFPMTLLSLVIFILLIQQLKIKNLNNKIIFWLFVTASFGFHFSSAYAIFYPVIILITLAFYKYRANLKSIIFAILGFSIPFIPQMLFEIKNNFVEVKAVITYFTKGESHSFGFEKILLVINTVIGEFKLLIFELPGNLKYYSLFVFILLISFSIYSVNRKKIDAKLKNIIFITSLFIIPPTLGFFFLHFNVWYVLPMIPAVTILLGTIFSKSPKTISNIFIILLVISSIFRVSYYLTNEKQEFINGNVHLPIKRNVISFIREDAGDRPFSVYSYLPDVYDFQYQYLFLTQGLDGKELPLEFAYEPNITSYVKEKENLLSVIDSKYGQRWKGTPKVIYYVVSDKTDSELLRNWWGRQKFEQIISEKEFGDKLVVYTAVPKK